MRRLLIANLVLLAALMAGFSYTGDGSNGFISGESITPTNMNEIDTAIDALQAADVTAASTYLPFTGGTMLGDITMGSGTAINLNSSFVIIGNGGGVEPSGTGYVLATGMSATGQIDDNDLAAGAVDGGTGGEIADGSITSADIADGTVTGTDILNDTVALPTDTSGDYVATVTGDTEITVSGTGTEGRAVTLAVASALTRDTELDAKSAATSTSGNIPKFSGTTGDLVDTGVAVDGSNNITTAGALSAGGSTGASTFTLRNMADSGWVECGVSGTTFTCAVDADGTPDGTL